MAASRSSRVTRSSVGLNGLDENFCGRTLRNRSIAQPEETSVSPLPRARSPKKKQESKHDAKQESTHDAKQESKHDAKKESTQDSKPDTKRDSKQETKQDRKPDTKRESKQDTKQESKQDIKPDTKQESKQNAKQESMQDRKPDTKQESKLETKQESKQNAEQESKQNVEQESKQESKQNVEQESKPNVEQESKPNVEQESKPNVEQESKPNVEQESKPNIKKDPEQESKHDIKQETTLDTLQESKQESRHNDMQVSNDIKQNTVEESTPESKLESQHDVKQETQPQETCLQENKQQDLFQRNVNNSSTLPGDVDQSTASRKRGVSCLENYISQEKYENSDPVKEPQGASPQTKRTKWCSRSGESQGQEEDHGFLKPESPVSVPEPCKDIICERMPSHNSSNTAPASPILCKLESDAVGQKVEEHSHVECDEVFSPPNSHKASNGFGETDVDRSSTLTEQTSVNPTSVTVPSSLLNGSRMGVPSSPDPSVPFTNSVPGQREISGSGELSASLAPTFDGASEDPVPDLIVAKEQEVEEVEVDVVGDPLCLAHEEQVVVSESDTNGRPPSPAQDAAASTSSSTTNTNCSSINNSNSGETTPLLTTPTSPTEPGCSPSIPSMSPSFTELYEHRYTLRTSPRRVVSGGKASPSKPSSPLTDNGPLMEEGEVVVGCPMVEELVCSDSLGPSSEQSDSVDPENEAVDKDGGFIDKKTSEEPRGSQAADDDDEEEEEEEEEEPDVYYFESDHLALKHNKDYQRLLQTIVVLEAQRTQAIFDLETLARRQRGALADPISFVDQLQKQVNLGMPCPQHVVQLPDIAWEQYTSGLGDFEREFCDKKRKTRQLNLIFDKGLPLRPKSPVEPKKEGECSSSYSSLPMSDAPENGRQTQMIRGRICHPNKPHTFNQLWTVEEQKKLEQLLLKYPPEEIESKRWQKIADELGNRTAKQVASRVQKYFIKLTKAGIPVPGRTPNLCMYTKKASSKKQHHLNRHLYRPSTFLTSYEPPVFMDEDDERSPYYNMQDPSADDSDEESVPVELRNLPEYKELLELKCLKKQKLQEIQEEKGGVQHLGFKCDVCGMEPIQGVRWHCQDCPPENAVDFCSNCSDCLFKTETHKPNHHLEPVYQSETFLDRDYCLPQSTGYNYLDPNYFPANR
ncbi:ZZ-type zinc finger-containing protein 3 isoform X2 [Nematolebias whitei]|uniref:ZZ-type zinc finger-containing protein 3 isoform X2 n=1 Tax=Nematolebias whitei TaxID=451745 RepID=UPI00189834EE|nr:ZZ-type zinc finger-containing protein 3 isoform X2 [Nematolebias whitei]